MKSTACHIDTIHPGRRSRRRRVLAFAIAVLLAFLVGLVFLGCSSKNNPTGPDGGGNSGAESFDSGTLGASANFVHTFPTAGTVGYHCTFHAAMGMTGTVTVVAGAPESAVVTASGVSFTPHTVSVRPGGHVSWTVTDGVHTVTSD